MKGREHRRSAPPTARVLAGDRRFASVRAAAGRTARGRALAGTGRDRREGIRAPRREGALTLAGAGMPQAAGRIARFAREGE